MKKIFPQEHRLSIQYLTSFYLGVPEGEVKIKLNISSCHFFPISVFTHSFSLIHIKKHSSRVRFGGHTLIPLHYLLPDGVGSSLEATREHRLIKPSSQRTNRQASSMLPLRMQRTKRTGKHKGVLELGKII